MSSGNKFVYSNSTIGAKRSSWSMNHRWQGSVYHGDLVPLEITEVMPGDEFIYNPKVLIRTATPFIAPLMDSIYASIGAFFVPKRLVWDLTKKFYGENEDGYGVQSDVLEPRGTSNISIPKADVATNGQAIATYLGNVHQATTVSTATPINLNTIRSFLSVYNNWFRNENFMDPYVWNHAQTGDSSYAIATLGGSTITGYSKVPKVCKKLDRYTSCLPWSQKSSSPVLLPLGDSAPVIGTGKGLGFFDGAEHSYLSKFGADNTVVITNEPGVKNYGDSTSGTALTNSEKVLGISGVAGFSGLKADLQNATAANVNQLRIAVATQRYLEQLARTGSRYREFIKGIFGVSIADKSAQIPEYLGGMSMPLNIAEVLQTTGAVSGAGSTLGTPGATSKTAGQGNLFHKAFDEPGYLVIVLYTKHDRCYGQGLEDLYRKQSIWDYYNPKFANIGEQSIKKSSLYFDGNKATDDADFGFQEAYSDYRYKPDKVIGLLASSNTNSYNFWNLSENMASQPTLNATFLTENRDYIARCLSGGISSPDYFVDIYFEVKATRVMPIKSIPGLMDHH